MGGVFISDGKCVIVGLVAQPTLCAHSLCILHKRTNACGRRVGHMTALVV